MYARNLGEETLTFGVSGKLIMNALVMYDHQTRSLWSQFLGRAVDGSHEGTELELIPALMTDWSTWVSLHPDTRALDKGSPGSYDPYVSYYQSGDAGILGETVRDDRLSTKEFVVGVEQDGEARAYPYRSLSETPVVNDTFRDTPILVVFDAESGTSAVFRREIEDEVYTFEIAEAEEGGPLLIVDRDTGTRWVALTGTAAEGPLADTVLEPFPSHLTFWFPWKDFHPHTEVYGQ